MRVSIEGPGEPTMSIRAIKRVSQSQPHVEGAGVHLRRAFGFGDPTEFDPFLLLDDFRNDNPAEYLAGFPWHPHRGIETITYVLAGTVEHLSLIHISEPTRLLSISYAVFCLKKKTNP